MVAKRRIIAWTAPTWQPIESTHFVGLIPNANAVWCMSPGPRFMLSCGHSRHFVLLSLQFVHVLTLFEPFLAYELLLSDKYIQKGLVTDYFRCN